MQFESDTQSHCFQAVGQALRQSFPSVVTDAHQPNYLLWQGSAMVEVQVRVFRGEICRIVARSLLIEKVRLTSGLMGWLLEQSELLEIGRFGTTDTDGITLSTSFLSCGPLDATALVASVHAILAQSDAYDDRIHDRWGAPAPSIASDKRARGGCWPRAFSSQWIS